MDDPQLHGFIRTVDDIPYRCCLLYTSMDLDATVKGANVNVEEIENLISAIVSVPIDDGVKFQLKSSSEIMDEAEYPVEMSIFKGVTTPSKVVVMLTRIPGYSASSIISEMLFS